MCVLFVVVSDQPDVNSNEQGKDQGLNNANQYLIKVKWNRHNEWRHTRHAGYQIFTTKHITVQSEGKRNRTKRDGDDLNNTDHEENRN